jgi:hypothetical protein
VIFNAILSQAPTSPLRINPELPPKLEEIISKALEKGRKLRYQTASDLRTDLQRLRRDTEPVRAGIGAAVGPRWSRRGVALTFALGVVALLAAMLGFNVAGLRDPPAGTGRSAPHQLAGRAAPRKSLRRPRAGIFR